MIESVLAQSDASFEVVVIDDGSIEGTPAILDRDPDTIRRYRQPNAGEGAARTPPSPHLRGEWVIFLHADDLLPSGYLERFAAAADEATEAEVFHCGWRGVNFDDDELLYFQEEPLAIDDDPFHELPVLGSPPINSLLVRRSAIEKSVDSTLTSECKPTGTSASVSQQEVHSSGACPATSRL